MTDIAVIILTKDEKLHVGRCLDRIAALSPVGSHNRLDVGVVDCQRGYRAARVYYVLRLTLGAMDEKDLRPRVMLSANVEEALISYGSRNKR